MLKMTSKYSKFTTEILMKKLDRLRYDDLYDFISTRDESEYSIEQIKAISTESDRELICSILIYLENLDRDYKKIKKEEEAKQLAEEKARLEEERLAQELANPKKEYHTIIDSGIFTALKKAFSIPMIDDMGELLYPSLEVQFETELKKYRQLKFLKAVYLDPPMYDEDREYMHFNTNKGFVSMYEDIGAYLFICFRLFKDPIDGKCIFISYWIVNCADTMDYLLDESPDSRIFSFEEVTNIDEFIQQFKRSESPFVRQEIYMKK